MKTIQIRNVSNGFVVTVPPTMGAPISEGKPNLPVEMVFTTWEQVTDFLMTDGFIVK